MTSWRTELTSGSDPTLEGAHRDKSSAAFMATFSVLILALSPPVFAGGRLDSLAANALKLLLVHLERSIGEVGDTTLYPTYATPQLRWKLKKSDEWTSGFYPGCLWYAFELSNEARFERWARQWTAALEHEKVNPETHDLGFAKRWAGVLRRLCSPPCPNDRARFCSPGWQHLSHRALQPEHR